MQVRWGIVGCGAVTEVKSGPGFQKACDSALVAVMRRDEAKARDYAQRHGVPRWYSRAEDLIHDPEVDIVSIATPPSSHCDTALRVCAAGKPALVEKPMATSYADCLRMIRAFEEKSLPLFVAYYRRALPRFAKVKALLQDGAIGPVRSVGLQMLQPAKEYDTANLPWRVLPEVAGGGLFVDIGSHTLDLVDHLVAPIARVKGLANNQGSLYPAEDSVSLAFECENGVVGTGLWQFSSYRYRDLFEIHGEKGTVQFATFDNQPIRLCANGAEHTFEIENPEHIQQPLIQTVVDQLNGGAPCPSTGVTAARTTRVMEELLRDYYQ